MMRPAHEQLAALQRKLEELAEDYPSDTITRDEWLTARRQLEERQDALKRQLSATRSQTLALEELTDDPGAIATAWDSRSLHQRRAAIAAVLDRVIVKPAVRGRNRFDRDRFETGVAGVAAERIVDLGYEWTGWSCSVRWIRRGW
jgi:hypothetical protein